MKELDLIAASHVKNYIYLYTHSYTIKGINSICEKVVKKKVDTKAKTSL